MEAENLGRLIRVSPREIWPNEAANFTPWLAERENLDLLGSTLGMELELEAQEKEVGPYRADIVCRDLADQTWVVVENQLEATDHSHLGQILTYAAGLDAVTVIWIATRFTDEHRAALDWLNEMTGESIRFFGLEVEAWRIGESVPAPKFNVVAKPNDWTKGGGRSQPARSAELSETRLLQRDFWLGFREYVLDRDGSGITPTKALPQHWMPMSIGRAWFGMSAVASTFNSATGTYDGGEVRAEVVVSDPALAKGYFRALQGQKDAIEADAGEPLLWDLNPDRTACRIYLRRDANLGDRHQWPELYGWLFEKLTLLDTVFRPLIRNLEPLSVDDDEPLGGAASESGQPTPPSL